MLVGRICVFKEVGGTEKENLSQCLGQKVGLFIYTIKRWFMWKEIKIVDSRGNKTINNKLTDKLCINKSSIVKTIIIYNII